MRNQWLNKWVEDIEYLKLELPQRHKNLFFQQNKKNFNNQIQELKFNIEKYDQYIIIVKIAKIVASFRDAHTTLIIPASRFIPFEFFWFAEGIYIVDTSEKHKEYLNCKVTHINDITIDEVIKRLVDIISHENNSFLKSQLPKYLSAAEVLFGLEIIDELEQVKFSLEDLNGNLLEVIVGTYKSNKFQTETVKIEDALSLNIPLYRKNQDKNYWSYFIEQQSTLYINYNRCKDMQGTTVESFCTDLMRFIKQKNVNRLVIDLRKNLGGNSTLFEPFISELRECEKLNKEGGIFVILGRDTFSSALLNAYSLKNKTAAIFVGEGTGGKPNCYGEVQYFELNNSKLKIRYSTEYYKIIKDDKQLSFFPEIALEVTFEDYIENKDPCMEYILNLGKK